MNLPGFTAENSLNRNGRYVGMPVTDGAGASEGNMVQPAKSLPNEYAQIIYLLCKKYAADPSVCIRPMSPD
jgi:hypothetical protein